VRGDCLLKTQDFAKLRKTSIRFDLCSMILMNKIRNFSVFDNLYSIAVVTLTILR